MNVYIWTALYLFGLGAWHAATAMLRMDEENGEDGFDGWEDIYINDDMSIAFWVISLLWPLVLPFTLGVRVVVWAPTARKWLLVVPRSWIRAYRTGRLRKQGVYVVDEKAGF